MTAWCSPAVPTIWSPERNLAPGAQLVWEDRSVSATSLGGVLYSETRPPARVLRLAPLDGPIPSNDPLKPLLNFGLRPQGDAPPRRVEALLDLDGPSTARLAVYLSSAANQAIADALKAAR